MQTQWTGTQYAGNVIHTNPGYWESGTGTNYIYVSTQTTGSVKGNLLQYQLCDSTTPVCTAALAAKDPTGTTVIDFGNGATPNVSANGSPATDAIVWAIRADGSVEGTTPGILYAFDSVSMKQIYSSTNTTCTTDVIHAATKFSVPTVANGNVYLGTQSDNVTNVGTGTFYIFGLGGTC